MAQKGSQAEYKSTAIQLQKKEYISGCICNSKTSYSCPLLNMALIGHRGQLRPKKFKESVEHLEMFSGEKWESVSVYSYIA